MLENTPVGPWDPLKHPISGVVSHQKQSVLGQSKEALYVRKYMISSASNGGVPIIFRLYVLLPEEPCPEDMDLRS